MITLFDDGITWYKGNLHTHTTLSDGVYPPEETAAVYRDAGYHFIAITDHLKYYDGWSGPDFIVLDGIECHDNEYKPGRVCHITGVGLSSPPPDLPAGTSPQRIMDTLKEHGAFVTLAHPAWSLMHHQDTLELTGYDAVEIYSGISHTYAGRGMSDGYTDVLAAAGRFPLLTAVDDSHFHDRDALLGYVMVNAPALTRESLLDSLRRGRFYASNGPSIRQIRIGEGRILVECDTDMAHIRFMSNAQWSRYRVMDGPIRTAEYKLMSHERYIRIECEDFEGRTAWSQIIPAERCR